LAYAEAGWYVLPTDPAVDIKSPGGVVGTKWHEKSSRDPDQIREWFSPNANYGIAIHVGRSGAGAFDLDINEIEQIARDGRPDIAEALCSAGAIQGTRREGDRGHYIFLMPEGAQFGNSAGAFMPWGQFRGKNGVIIAAPTPHPDAKTKDGEYRQLKTGPVTPMPDVLRDCLSEAAESKDPLTDAGLDEFLDKYTGGGCGRENCRHKIAGPISKYNAKVDDGASRYQTLVEISPWSFSEAMAGCYTAREVFGTLHTTYTARFGPEDGDRLGRVPGEFMRVMKWAAAQANPERAHRNDELPIHAADDGERITRSLADVTPTKVEWLWRGWLPLGKVSILEGEPEEGKSVITLAWAAIVTRGYEWPPTIVDDEPLPLDQSEPADVVLVGVEDDEADTVVPRLDAAGADRTRVHVMNQPVDDKGNPISFVIPEDIDRLRRAIDETGAKLVVIDPITAFLSTKRAKAGDDPSTRQALMPLVEVAGDTGCAIVLVRHLNKTQGMRAKHRGSGTIAYTGIARSVIVAGELKEPKENGPTHAIALTKGNLTKRPQAIGYRLDSATGDAESPVIIWLGALDLSADQLVGADGAKVSDARKTAPVRDECERVLGELLADGPMPMKEAIKKTRDAVGCGAGSVHDAAKRLGVLKKSVRAGGVIAHWTWEMPPTKIQFRLIDRDGNGGEGDLEDPES
jgi:hypothetical protein